MDFSAYFWCVQLVLGLGILLGLQYGVKKIITLLGKKRARFHHDWRNSLGSIIQPPLALMIWAVGIGYVLDTLGHHFNFPAAFKYFYPLRGLLVVGAFVWLWMRWWSAFQKCFLQEKHSKVDPTTIHMLGRVITVGIIMVAGLFIMQILGVDTVPLVAFGSIGAASIGFAGKDVVANFCSGFLLHLTRPCVIGDTIHLPEKDLEGVVEEIGWFRTLIRDKNKRAVYLPNNFFSTMLLFNDSRVTHRRFKQKICIPFESVHAVAQIVKEIHTLFKETIEIDPGESVYVYLDSYTDQGCEIKVEAYSTVVDQKSFYVLQQRLLLEIQQILDNAKVSLAQFRVELKN